MWYSSWILEKYSGPLVSCHGPAQPWSELALTIWAAGWGRWQTISHLTSSAACSAFRPLLRGKKVEVAMGSRGVYVLVYAPREGGKLVWFGPGLNIQDMFFSPQTYTTLLYRTNILLIQEIPLKRGAMSLNMKTSFLGKKGFHAFVCIFLNAC